MSRQDLFPPIEPYATGMLPLDAHHTMYWEQSGNPARRADRVPAWRARRRRDRDPSPLFRSVALPHRRLRPARRRPLDCRWARSPTTRLRHLVADLETLRRHLGIERWAVFGGSWGSTLALAYAEAHPERCRGAGAARHLPVPPERDRLVPLRHAHGLSRGVARLCRASSRRPSAATCSSAYYRRLIDPDPARAHAGGARLEHL